jgi:large subunit ribosomal protein L4
MKLDITTLEGQTAGSVELNEAIFGLEPRADLLARCVRWQLAKRQAGTHVSKGRSDVDRTTKKVRALALKHALSSKAKGQALVVIDEANLPDGKTKVLVERFGKLGLANALIIGGTEVDAGFQRAARNIANIDVLPVQGINVYDILRRETLVLTRAAVDALEARFK